MENWISNLTFSCSWSEKLVCGNYKEVKIEATNPWKWIGEFFSEIVDLMHILLLYLGQIWISVYILNIKLKNLKDCTVFLFETNYDVNWLNELVCEL